MHYPRECEFSVHQYTTEILSFTMDAEYGSHNPPNSTGTDLQPELTILSSTTIRSGACFACNGASLFGVSLSYREKFTVSYLLQHSGYPAASLCRASTSWREGNWQRCPLSRSNSVSFSRQETMSFQRYICRLGVQLLQRVRLQPPSSSFPHWTGMVANPGFWWRT